MKKQTKERLTTIAYWVTYMVLSTILWMLLLENFC